MNAEFTHFDGREQKPYWTKNMSIAAVRQCRSHLTGSQSMRVYGAITDVYGGNQVSKPSIGAVSVDVPVFIDFVAQRSIHSESPIQMMAELTF